MPDATLLWWLLQAPSSWQEEGQRQRGGFPNSPGQGNWAASACLGRLLELVWAFFEPRRAEGEAWRTETLGSVEPQCHPAEFCLSRPRSTGPFCLGIRLRWPGGALRPGSTSTKRGGQGLGGQHTCTVAKKATLDPRRQRRCPTWAPRAPRAPQGSPGLRGVASAAAMLSAQQLQLQLGAGGPGGWY